MTTVSLPRNFLVNARGLTIADSASAVWSFNPNTNTLTLAAGGGATGFANPTAAVGFTAVNGAATTAMRSDGSPALSASIYSSLNTPSTLVYRDANGNTHANNFESAITGNAATGTITLTNASSRVQTFTSGSGSAIVVLPDATTLHIGHTLELDNNASGNLTVQLSGTGTTYLTMLPGAYLVLQCLSTSFPAGQWNYYLVPSGANPTGSIGLSAVNGVATTFTRSDATHALDQSIAPTWTGLHTFTPGAGTAITITAFSAGTPCISMTDKGSGVHFGNSGGGSFDLGLLAGVGSPDAYIFQRANANLIIGTNGATRVNIAGTGAITANAPASGDTLTLTNVAGANALTVNGNAAGTAVVRLNTQATTGAQTITIGLTNFPGTNSGAKTPKYIPVNIDGSKYWIQALPD